LAGSNIHAADPLFSIDKSVNIAAYPIGRGTYVVSIVQVRDAREGAPVTFDFAAFKKLNSIACSPLTTSDAADTRDGKMSLSQQLVTIEALNNGRVELTRECFANLPVNFSIGGVAPSLPNAPLFILESGSVTKVKP
jgi:hypothetical protein